MRSRLALLLDVPAWTTRARYVAGSILVGGCLLVAGAATSPEKIWRLPNPVYQAFACRSAFEGSPSWSPDGRQIVFAKHGSCDTRLFVVTRDGSHLRGLRESRSGDEYPAWSPRGNTIAFVTGDALETIRADGTHRHRVRGDHSDFGAAWSPDARRLAYSHGLLPGPGGDLETSLYVTPSNGSMTSKIAGHQLNAGTPAWSPDGRLIAAAGHDGIYVMGDHGQHPVRLWPEDFGFNPVALAWSPNGQTIAFVDSHGVEALNVKRRTVRTLVPIRDPAGLDAVSWTRDGSTIAFSITDGGDPGIYTAHADGSNARRIVVL